MGAALPCPSSLNLVVASLLNRIIKKDLIKKKIFLLGLTHLRIVHNDLSERLSTPSKGCTGILEFPWNSRLFSNFSEYFWALMDEIPIGIFAYNSGVYEDLLSRQPFGFKDVEFVNSCPNLKHYYIFINVYI